MQKNLIMNIKQLFVNSMLAERIAPDKFNWKQFFINNSNLEEYSKTLVLKQIDSKKNDVQKTNKVEKESSAPLKLEKRKNIKSNSFLNFFKKLAQKNKSAKEIKSKKKEARLIIIKQEIIL